MAAKCIFCDLSALAARQRVLYEDSTVFAIQDRRPRAAKHLLIVPKRHIDNVDALQANDTELLEHMLETGKEMMTKEGYNPSSDCRFGFHRPPFASVSHLHLHCIGLPFTSFWNRLRFIETPLHSYIGISSVINSLRQQKDH